MLVDFDKLKEKCSLVENGSCGIPCKYQELTFYDCICKMAAECVVEQDVADYDIITNINLLGAILDCKHKLQQGDKAIGKIDYVAELILDKIAKVLRDDSK